MAKKHLNITVTGLVQGVWYRATAVERAKELGLSGFVRNQPDGSVYLEAEGEENPLQALLQWCHDGPPGARVDQVSVEEGELSQFENFELRF